MADILHRYTDTIYDYSIYNFAANIPLEGERRYFDTILAGITHPCSVMGDGVSQANALPFIEIVNIESNINISLEILRINRNKVIIKNTGGGDITVNLGTAGVPVNYILTAGSIRLWKFNGANWEEFPRQFPIGGVIMHGGAAAPDGWLLCDGSSLLRAGVYADLFSIIGVTFGSADGAHFNVPDFRGIFPRGAGAQTIGAQTFTGVLGTVSGDTTAPPDTDFTFDFEYATNAADGVVRRTPSIAGANLADVIHPSGGGDAETAPANLGITFIIKYN